MSTGADCGFFETAKDVWEYRLQDYPYGANESYTTYGPFKSLNEGLEHLGANHANPGGFGVVEFEPGPATVPEPYVPILADAEGPHASGEKPAKKSRMRKAALVAALSALADGAAHDSKAGRCAGFNDTVVDYGYQAAMGEIEGRLRALIERAEGR